MQPVVVVVVCSLLLLLCAACCCCVQPVVVVVCSLLLLLCAACCCCVKPVVAVVCSLLLLLCAACCCCCVQPVVHQQPVLLVCSLQLSDSDLEGQPILVRSSRNRLSRLNGYKKKKVTFLCWIWTIFEVNDNITFDNPGTVVPVYARVVDQHWL